MEMSWIDKLYGHLREANCLISLLDEVYEVEDEVLDFVLENGPGDECSFQDIADFIGDYQEIDSEYNKFIDDVRDLLEIYR